MRFTLLYHFAVSEHGTLLRGLWTPARWLAPRLPWLLLYLVGGVACNLLIAWGGCLVEPPERTSFNLVPARDMPWRPTYASARTPPKVLITAPATAICDWSDVYILVDASRSAKWHDLPDLWARTVEVDEFDGVVLRAGWPRRSVYVAMVDSTLDPGKPREQLLAEDELAGAWRIPWGLGAAPQEFRILPNRILWWGAVMNSLLFAGVLLALVTGPRLARSAMWRSKGRCGNCGYPLGGAAICSECGKGGDW